MLDLPVCPGVRDGRLIDPDVLFITESDEFLAGELRVVVGDHGVRYSKMMDDVVEEHHSLLGLDHRDRSSLYPLCKLVYSDKQVRIAPGHSLDRSDHIEPLDREWPHDGDRFGVLGPVDGSIECSIDILHKCTQSIQRQLLRSASRSLVGMCF